MDCLQAKCLQAISLIKHLSHLSCETNREILPHLYKALGKCQLDYKAPIYGVILSSHRKAKTGIKWVPQNFCQNLQIFFWQSAYEQNQEDFYWNIAEMPYHLHSFQNTNQPTISDVLVDHKRPNRWSYARKITVWIPTKGIWWKKRLILLLTCMNHFGCDAAIPYMRITVQATNILTWK